MTVRVDFAPAGYFEFADQLEMSAEGRGPAHLDGSHDAPLPCGHRRAMLFPIGYAIAAEDIRYFSFGRSMALALKSAEA